MLSIFFLLLFAFPTLAQDIVLSDVDRQQMTKMIAAGSSALYSINKVDCTKEVAARPTKAHQQGNLTSFTADNVSQYLGIFNVALQMSKVLKSKEVCMHIKLDDVKAKNPQAAKVTFVLQNLKNCRSRKKLY